MFGRVDNNVINKFHPFKLLEHYRKFSWNVSLRTSLEERYAHENIYVFSTPDTPTTSLVAQHARLLGPSGAGFLGHVDLILSSRACVAYDSRVTHYPVGGNLFLFFEYTARWYSAAVGRTEFVSRRPTSSLAREAEPRACAHWPEVDVDIIDRWQHLVSVVAVVVLCLGARLQSHLEACEYGDEVPLQL